MLSAGLDKGKYVARGIMQTVNNAVGVTRRDDGGEGQGSKSQARVVCRVSWCAKRRLRNRCRDVRITSSSSKVR